MRVQHNTEPFQCIPSEYEHGECKGVLGFDKLKKQIMNKAGNSGTTKNEHDKTNLKVKLKKAPSSVEKRRGL